MLRVTVLGCGGSAGVPLIGGPDGFGDWGACDPKEPRNRRTRASIVVESGDRRLLVDTSPDLRAQLLNCGVPRVDAILYTHPHADHIAGLDDVRILNRTGGRPLDAFGTAETLAELARRFDYAFRPWQPPSFLRPVLAPKVVAPDDCAPMAGMPVALFPQDHGFSATLGLRIGPFAYSTDVVALSPEVLDRLRGVHTWLVDCFQREPHSTHAHLGLICEWVARVAPRRTVLTHMGADMDWAWMEANLPPGIEPAYDGQVLEVPEREFT